MKEKIIRSLKLENANTQIDGEIRYIYGKIPYNTKSQRMFVGYSNCQYEKLDRNVFHKTLGDKSNVYANYSHDSNKILGSTKAGTLELEDKEDGLYIRCKVPNTTWGNDTWEVISRGDVTTMSFEFIPFDWKDDKTDNTVTLRSAKLEAVSFCVSEPAYLETDSYASFRCLLQKRNIDPEKLAESIEKGEVTEDVENLAKALNDLIAKNKPVEQPVVEEKAVEVEQSKDTPAENTQTETKVEETEEYKEKMEQLKEFEKELAEELQTI